MNNSTDTEDYDLASPFLFTPGSVRLVQIQPTLQCNLRCRHCYSESSPEHHEVIPLRKLQGFLLEAGQLGYNYVGVSGGEPLLWRDLESFLEFALAEGFSTSVSTNGTLLNRVRAERLRDLTGLVAVSVDGPPKDHAAIRDSPTAFPMMQAGLSVLREAGIPFTLAFTLTRYNADRLSWLYEFACTEGASGLHVHPLSGTGAAARNLLDAVPDSIEFQVAALLMALLSEQHGPGGPAVIFDVIKRDTVEHSCWPLLKNETEAIRTAAFTDLVPSLVVEPDGCIVPFTYGFPRQWSLGAIDQQPLAEAAEKWRSASSPKVTELIQITLERMEGLRAEYFDLFGELMITTQD